MQRKTKRRAYFFGLAAVVLVVSAAAVIWANQDPAPAGGEGPSYGDDRKAMQAQQILSQSFYRDKDHTYPENYAGAHMEDGFLYIHIVDLEKQDLSQYQTLLAEQLDAVRFVNAQYRLDVLQAEAQRTFRGLAEKGIRVVAYTAKSTHNIAVVSVEPSEKGKLRLSRKNVPEKRYYRLVREGEEIPVYIEFEGVPTAM